MVAVDSPTFGGRSPEPPQPNVQEQQAQELAQWSQQWERAAFEQQGPFPIREDINLVRVAESRVAARGQATDPTTVAQESLFLHRARQDAQRRGRARRGAQQELESILRHPRYSAAAVPPRNPLGDDALRTQPGLPPGDDFRDMRPATPLRDDARNRRPVMPSGVMPQGDDFRDMRPVTPPGNGANVTSRWATNGTPSPVRSPRGANADAGRRYQPYPSSQQPPSGRGRRRGSGGPG
ncbi:hypothetical protein GCM10009863_17840 [Streptomyces axinellae]|uniref:Uncharacterized protein n=1 Tax=Streptomyces axinellae TaxID=552788 RepID=A0ABP6C8Q0_9ACTN